MFVKSRLNWICFALLSVITLWRSVTSVPAPYGRISSNIQRPSEVPVLGGLSWNSNSNYQRYGEVAYIMNPVQRTWMEAEDVCHDQQSELFCFPSKTELVSLLKQSLELWKGTEIWLGKTDCDNFGFERCASLSIKNFGMGRNESWEFSHNCSKSLQFICKRVLQVPVTEPPPISKEPQDKSVVCPSTTKRNIDWPRSIGGTLVRIECPAGQIGYAYWTCSVEHRDWYPRNPNLSDCKSIQMSQVFQKMPKLDLIQTTNDLHQTIKNLQYGGDVTTAIDILDRVDDVYRSQAPAMTPLQRRSVIEESSMDIIRTCDMLVLSKEAWQDIPELIRTETGSKFLSAVDETGLLLVENFPHSVKLLLTENVVLQMIQPQGLSSPYLQFPSEPNWQKKLARIRVPVTISPNDNTSGVIFAWYSDLRNVLPSDQIVNVNPSSGTNRAINTGIISANVTGRDVTFKGEVHIVLEHLEEGGSNPQCVYWDTQALKWNTEGCKLFNSNKTHTECVCTHLTNFAVLMDIECANCDMSSAEKLGLNIVTMTGCLVSLFCLSICIVIFSIFRTLWSIQNTIHRNLCICLWIAQVLLLAGLDRTENAVVCSVIAGVMVYFFLAAFFWMFLESFHILLLVINVFTPKKLRVFQYYLVGYGAPVLIVGITASMRHRDFGTPYYCWLSTDNGTIWSFIGPVIAIVAFNSVALLVALWTMFRITASKEKTKIEGLRMWIRGAAVLLPLLGITWALGFLYLEFNNIYMAYAFAILNSLQGFGIFICHVLLNKKVKTVINRSIERSSVSRSGTNRTTKSSSFQGLKFSRKKAVDSSQSDTGGDSSSTLPITNDSKPTTSGDDLTDEDFKLRETPRMASFSPTDPIPEEPEIEPEDEVKYIDNEVEPTETDPLNEPEKATQSITPLKQLPGPLNPRIIFTPTPTNPVSEKAEDDDEPINESSGFETQPLNKPAVPEPPKTKLETEIT